MFLELAEALDCPRCRSAVGLVAFVAEAEGRRVLRGRLGCPLCEIEYPIAGGAIDFGADDGPDTLAPTGPASGAELSLRVAALLGVPELRGGAILLGPGLSDCAVGVARHADHVEVMVWVEGRSDVGLGFDPDQLAAGLDPLHGASADSWPIRGRFLHGIALRGACAAHLDEAARCLREGGRLLLLDAPREVWTSAIGLGFEELVRDESTWLGQRG